MHTNLHLQKQSHRYVLIALLIAGLLVAAPFVLAFGHGGGMGDSWGDDSGTADHFGGCGNVGGGDGGASGYDEIGGGGSWQPAPAPPPTAAITCGPSIVGDGEPAVVSWSCGGPSTASIGSGFGTGGALSGHLSVFPVQDSTYSVTCTAGARAASASCAVGLRAPTTIGCTVNCGTTPTQDNIANTNSSAAPSGSIITGGGDLSASSSWLECFPRTITPGESVRLRWNCANSSSSILGDITGSETLYSGAQNYGQIIVNPSALNTYKLTCNEESYTSQCTIRVSSEPSVSIEATPLLVPVGRSSRVTWSSVAAHDCSVTGPGILSNALAGSQVIPVLGESIYTINCADNLTDSVTVHVLPDWNEQ